MKKSFSRGFASETSKKSKGISGILIVIVVFLVIFGFLFFLGVANNYSKEKAKNTLDVFGFSSLFLAVSETFANFITLGNLLIWTLVFFVVQALFLFAYYEVIRFFWVHLPQYQNSFNRMRQRLGL